MGTYALWARSDGEDAASLRQTGGKFELESEARRLARGSGDEGALSVWVQNRRGEVVWSAGEKHTELNTPEEASHAE